MYCNGGKLKTRPVPNKSLLFSKGFTPVYFCKNDLLIFPVEVSVSFHFLFYVGLENIYITLDLLVFDSSREN